MKPTTGHAPRMRKGKVVKKAAPQKMISRSLKFCWLKERCGLMRAANICALQELVVFKP